MKQFVEEFVKARNENVRLRAAHELLCEGVNDLFHVLISDFDQDPMNCVENYLPWPAEKRFAFRAALAAAAEGDGDASHD